MTRQERSPEMSRSRPRRGELIAGMRSIGLNSVREASNMRSARPTLAVRRVVPRSLDQVGLSLQAEVGGLQRKSPSACFNWVAR